MKKKYLLLLLPFAAYSSCSEAADISLQVHGASYHFDRTRERNETNEGLGFTLQTNSNTTYSVGQYQNSHWRTSRYISVGKFAKHSSGFIIGLEGGLVDGYEFADLKPIPYITPYVGYGPVRLRFIPKNDGALGLSLSIPLTREIQ